MRPLCSPATAILAATFALAACGDDGSNGRIHASGHIEATEVRLAAKVGGRLLEAPFEEGDAVRAGDVVARFETVDLEHQLEGPAPRSTPPMPGSGCCSPAPAARTCGALTTSSPRPSSSSMPPAAMSPGSRASPTAEPRPSRRATMRAPGVTSRTARSRPRAPSSTSWSPDRAGRRSRPRGRSTRRPRRGLRPSSSRSSTRRWSRPATVWSPSGWPSRARCWRRARPCRS